MLGTEDFARLLEDAHQHLVDALAGAYRIYGMSKNVTFTDPHPSFTNQTWKSLSITAK